MLLEAPLAASCVPEDSDPPVAPSVALPVAPPVGADDELLAFSGCPVVPSEELSSSAEGGFWNYKYICKYMIKDKQYETNFFKCLS